MADIPASRLAIVIEAPNALRLVVQDIPTTLSPSHVLVKVACIALNPSDAKMVAGGFPIGSVAGTEFSGTIVARGNAVSTMLPTGQRVCGISLGYNDNVEEGTGAFSTYTIADSRLLLPIPDELGFEDAATLPAGILTAGLVLYQTMRLKQKPSAKSVDSNYVLVYGGSTTSGTLMIQLLRHSGYAPITTCSPSSFALVKCAGASDAFDYHNADGAISAIRSLTKARLAYVIDCITTPESMRICYGALGSEGGRYVALDKFPIANHSRRSVRPSWVFAMRALGRDIDWGGSYKCVESRDNLDFAIDWTRKAGKLLQDRAVKPLRWEVVSQDGGLDAVMKGLVRLQRGDVSGAKLVCPM